MSTIIILFLINVYHVSSLVHAHHVHAHNPLQQQRPVVPVRYENDSFSFLFSSPSRICKYPSSVTFGGDGGDGGDGAATSVAAISQTKSVNLLVYETSTTAAAASYHLFWTPGFARKFALTTIAFSVCHRLVAARTRIFLIPTFSEALIVPLSSIGLSLLASSCCLIQILANVLVGAVGCLGLNSVLGPSRPYFLSLLFYVTFFTSGTTVPQILLRFSIAFLPELVHFWNNQKRVFSANKITSSSSMMSANSSRGMVATVEFDIPTMGCVACINKIDSLLRNQFDQEKVVVVTSWLDSDRPKGGTAKVILNVGSKEEAVIVSQSLVEAVESIGFGGSSISKLELAINDNTED